MKEYKPTELKEQNPELTKEILSAHQMAVSKILKDVDSELRGKPRGSALIHSCFMRLEDDLTKEVIFVEIEALFVNVDQSGIVVASAIRKIIIHDNLQEYEAARMVTENQKLPKTERLPNGTKLNMN